MLGLTFKEDCPDLRNSRVPDIIKELQSYGVTVNIHDAYADAEEAKHEYGYDLTAWDKLPPADALVVAVAHRAYRDLSPADLLAKLKPNGCVVDVKAVLDQQQLRPRPTPISPSGASDQGKQQCSRQVAPHYRRNRVVQPYLRADDPGAAQSQAPHHLFARRDEAVGDGQSSRMTRGSASSSAMCATANASTGARRCRLRGACRRHQDRADGRVQPFECVKTSINGAMNLIDACIDKGVKRVVALSTGQGQQPGQSLRRDQTRIRQAVRGRKFLCRWPRHPLCRGALRQRDGLPRLGHPFFLSIRDKGVLPVTDDRMTRFMISLEQGVELVWHAFNDMVGGEIYVKKIPSMKVTDLAAAVAPEANRDRRHSSGRKAPRADDQSRGFLLYLRISGALQDPAGDPQLGFQRRTHQGWQARSGRLRLLQRQQSGWMSIAELQAWIAANQQKIGAI